MNNFYILENICEEYLETDQINPKYIEELTQYTQGVSEIGEEFLGSPIDLKDKSKGSYFSKKDKVYLFGKKGGEFSHVLKIYQNSRDAFGEKIAYDLLSPHLPPFAQLARLDTIGNIRGSVFWIMERVKGLAPVDVYGKMEKGERITWTEKLAIAAARIHRENISLLSPQQLEPTFNNKLRFLEGRIKALPESTILKKVVGEEMPKMRQLAQDCLKEPMSGSLAFGDFHESNYLFSLESQKIHFFDQCTLIHALTKKKMAPLNREYNVALALTMLDSLAIKTRISLKEVASLKESFISVWNKETDQKGSFNGILFCYRHRILAKLLLQISKAPSNLNLIVDLYFDYLSSSSFLT